MIKSAYQCMEKEAALGKYRWAIPKSFFGVSSQPGWSPPMYRMDTDKLVAAIKEQEGYTVTRSEEDGTVTVSWN